MTAHVDTGEPLPRALFDKMLAAKNFQSGMQTLRQIEFALFDMLPAHRARSRRRTACPAGRGAAEVAVVQPPEYNRFPTPSPHLRRRLRGGLLQLQVGRSAVGRCLRRFRGNELQQIASRYPVTLYTGDNCGPCASGRNLLTARGIPFTERTVTTPEDAAALQRMSGDTSLPFITIGGQQIKGYADTEWTQFLDAAGYPKTSQLPPGYRASAPTPFVAVQRPVSAAPGAAAATTGGTSGESTGETFNTRPRPAATPTPVPNTNPANIRF
jgi:glutaredoxin